MKPRLLDLFSCEGGAAEGYSRAGFDVTGVDINDQPRYPFRFIRSDALTFLKWLTVANCYDAVHASPPCQANVKGLAAVNEKLGRVSKHRDMIAEVREALIATGLPYVIENVEGAELRNPVRLCGSSFGLAVRRHRLFETNFPVMAPPCAHHLQQEAKYWTSWRPNGEERKAKVVQVYGNAGDSSEWAGAMGIDWMSRDGLREAIPPAYCEHVGGFLLAEVVRRQSVESGRAA